MRIKNKLAGCTTHMLLFLGVAEGLFLFHRFKEQFIGEDIPNRPGPVSIEKAIDLKPLRGNKKNTYITLENQNRKSFDIRYGITGTFLDYYTTHRRENQSFRLALTSANTFLLVQGGRCINWVESETQFFKVKCAEANFGEFDIFYETVEHGKTKNSTPRAPAPTPADGDNREFLELMGGRKSKSRAPKRPQARLLYSIGNTKRPRLEESDSGLEKRGEVRGLDHDSKYSLKLTKVSPRRARRTADHHHEITDSSHCHESSHSSSEEKISSEILELINNAAAVA